MGNGEREARQASFRVGGIYLLAVASSWLFPGAGHWLLGHRGRALLLSILLLGIFWWGEAIAGGYAVIRKEHPIFFYGQIGNGLSTLVADRLQWADVAPRDDEPNAAAGQRIDRNIPPGLAMGILLTSISGLLNVLLVLHVMDPRSWQGRPELWQSAAPDMKLGGPGGGRPGVGGEARRRP